MKKKKLLGRRGFFGRMAALAAAAVVAPAVGGGKVAEAATFEPTSDLWFTESAIQHGDGPTGWYMENGERRFIIDGVEVEQAIRDARAEGYERREFIEAKRTENQIGDVTFDALQAACSARGCLLENQYSIERLRHEFFHLKRGQEWPDETLTMRHADPQKVYAWLKELHA